MFYQDPMGDTLTTGSEGIPPLVGYGADSTMDTGSGSDAIPTSVSMPAGATPAMETPEPSASPQNLGGPEATAADEEEGGTLRVTEVEIDDLEEQSWNLRRASLIGGIVVAGLAAGAGIAWFVISRRRAQQARLAAAQVAQARLLQSATAIPLRERLAAAVESGTTLTQRARQSARDVSALAAALAESALESAQEARERALVASQLFREQTANASQFAQGKLADTQSILGDTMDILSDTLGKTRETAGVSWEAAIQTAKTARDATLRTANVAREAAKQTAKTARNESKRTAKVARAGFGKAQRTATR